MFSRWQVRGVATLAMLALAAGGELATAQAPGTGTGTGTSPTTPGQSAAPGRSGQAATPGQTGEAATSGQTATSGPSSELDRTDKAFLRKAAEGGLAEVQLGQLAEQQGSSEAVKQFGQRMVTDHSKANDQLMTIAQNLNVPLPTTLSKHDQKEFDKLKSLHGTAFDKAYARDMRMDHRLDIHEFEREAKHGKDTQLKQFADSTLPTLKEHLALAEKLPGSSRTASASETGTEPATR